MRLATRRAVKQVLASKVPFDEVVIDGTNNFLVGTPLADRVTVLKKADLLVKEVSAASIIAKVARDHYMIQLAKTYPEYGFESHVGYGTAAHKQTLLQYGVTPEHRKSFRPIRDILENGGREIVREQVDPEYHDNIINDNPITSTDHGQTAELAVAHYLEDQGHQIVAHNFKTKEYEIDLISTCADKIYFTEVKYRKTATHGTSIEQITHKKRQQMEFAAKSFLASHSQFQNFQPLLAAAGVSGTNFTIDDWFPII